MQQFPSYTRKEQRPVITHNICISLQQLLRAELCDKMNVNAESFQARCK